MIETYRSFAKVFFWLLVRHLCWCRCGRGRDGAFGSHKLYNSKCELAYEALSTYGLAFLPSLIWRSVGITCVLVLVISWSQFVTHGSVRE